MTKRRRTKRALKRRPPDPETLNWRQRAIIREFEDYLGTTPNETALVLGVPYSTYMKWRIGTRTMTSGAQRCMYYARYIVRAGLDLPLVDAEDEREKVEKNEERKST